MNLRVVTYNFHKGKNIWGKKFPLDQLKLFLENEDFDIGCFQEILGSHNFDNATIHQIESLADKRWPQYSFAKNSIVDNYEHGNCIISKYPIIDEVILNISVNKLEKRSALLALIDLGPTKINILCTHLNLLKKDRLKQVHLILNFLKTKKNNYPLILAGDLNDWDGKISDILIKDGGFTQKIGGNFLKTFPSLYPILPLDRILYKDIKMLSLSVGTTQRYNLFSDHLPLFSVLEVPIQKQKKEKE